MMSTKFPAIDLLTPSLSINDVVTPELYVFLVAAIVADVTDNLLKPENCLICSEPLIESSEGQAISKDECWYEKYTINNKKTGRYYCKNTAGTLLGNNTVISPSTGIQSFKLTKDDKAISPSMLKELSELPYNIIGNEKQILTAVTDPDNKRLILNIDVPGYSKSDIKIILSKTSFIDFQINIFMDNKIKGPKELSFQVAAELYEPEWCQCEIHDGLLTLFIKRRATFGTKSLPLNTASTGV